MAMAETRLVNETKEFLEANEVAPESRKRSDKALIAKNLANGVHVDEVRRLFSRYGPVKSVTMAPGGLSAIVEMSKRPDARKAFDALAYSRFHDQPLYLEWAPVKEKKTVPIEEKIVSADAIAPEEADEKRLTKIIVRNVPFQASLKELTQLFSAFGEIKTIRLPKKVITNTYTQIYRIYTNTNSQTGSNAHRGFCFVDFLTSGDAKRAFEAVVHSTHLYGRRLVVEWARADESVDELRAKSAHKLEGASQKATKRSKKQIRAAIENAEGEEED